MIQNRIAETILICSLLIQGMTGSARAEETVTALLKERAATALRLREVALNRYTMGVENFQAVIDATAALLGARLDLASSRQERIKVLEEILELAQSGEKYTQAKFDAGQVTESDVLKARLFRLEVTISLERARAPK